MEKSFVIRSATEEDTPLILFFIQALAEYEHLGHEVRATAGLLRETLFVQHQAEVLIAEESGKPVGFALFFHNFSTFWGCKGLHLEDLFVLPECRGRGYGKALLKRLAQIAIERGCPRMEWWCLDWNTPSIAFYKALGAKQLDEWTTYRLTQEHIRALAEE